MNANTNSLRRILIVDDNDSIHRDFEKILAGAPDTSELDALDAELFGESQRKPKGVSFDLSHAMQGKQGLQVLQETLDSGHIFGAAFVDMRMPPGWDGVETIERLWEVDPHLQVVICTAFSDHSWEEITDRLGHTDRLLVLKKPFDEIEVVQLATSLCEKRRLLQESLRRMEDLQQVVGAQAAELQEAHNNSDALIRSISSAMTSLDAMGK